MHEPESNRWRSVTSSQRGRMRGLPSPPRTPNGFL